MTGVYNIIQTWGQLSFNRIQPLGPQQDPNLGSDELLLSKILGSFFQRKVYLGCNRTPTWGQVKYIRTPLIFTNSGCNTTPTWGQMNCSRTQSLGHSSREKWIWVVTGPQLGVRSTILGPHQSLQIHVVTQPQRGVKWTVIIGSFFQRKVNLGCNRTSTWGQVNYIRTPSWYANSGCNTTPTWGCNRTQSSGHSSREK